MKSWRVLNFLFTAYISLCDTELCFLVAVKKRINTISMGHHLTAVVGPQEVNRPVVVEVAPRNPHPNFKSKSLTFKQREAIS